MPVSINRPAGPGYRPGRTCVVLIAPALLAACSSEPPTASDRAECVIAVPLEAVSKPLYDRLRATDPDDPQSLQMLARELTGTSRKRQECLATAAVWTESCAELASRIAAACTDRFPDDR